MSRETPWLPDTALTTGRAATPFVEMVEKWTKAWFGTGGWSAARAFAPAASDEMPMLREGVAVTLRGRARVALDLGFALLGMPSRGDCTEEDLRLLRRVAGEALDDLQQRADGVVSAVRPSAGNSAARLSLAIGPVTGAALQLDVADDALTAVARSTFAPTARRSVMASRTEAGREVAIDYSIWLGQAELAVQQVSALEPGDIIVLDQLSDQPVRLTLAGKPTALRFAIDSRGDNTTLVMQDF